MEEYSPLLKIFITIFLLSDTLIFNIINVIVARDANKQELEDAFSYYGLIKDVWISLNPHGFAFVVFDNSRDAKDAVDGLDGR